MEDQQIPRKISEKMTDMTAHCGHLFQQSPDELAQIVSFVEAEMKGQDLPPVSRNRDEFIAATFERLYPMVLSSDDCRQAVESMLKKRPDLRQHQPLDHHDDYPHYTLDPALTETLYLTGSAVMGSILMVTAGASGGSIEQRQQTE
ncbi:hypothetical protein [Melghirimyces algeriensis]|uniref:Uncharacterized protein n=1 Tax=Melghirimyces algeriensis TaxID=910412 RepID=A0A521FDR5_9BACL|nr:hypothetical protein [Melghirimyces algeriensis]SMO94315.1 hypothetical protein SAMN06264849_1174 [Melghirimyces algeriensis]